MELGNGNRDLTRIAILGAQVAKIGNRKICRLISYDVAGVVVRVDNFKGGDCL